MVSLFLAPETPTLHDFLNTSQRSSPDVAILQYTLKYIQIYSTEVTRTTLKKLTALARREELLLEAIGGGRIIREYYRMIHVKGFMIDVIFSTKNYKLFM